LGFGIDWLIAHQGSTPQISFCLLEAQITFPKGWISMVPPGGDVGACQGQEKRKAVYMVWGAFGGIVGCVACCRNGEILSSF
jgi:hypothetical protein